MAAQQDLARWYIGARDGEDWNGLHVSPRLQKELTQALNLINDAMDSRAHAEVFAPLQNWKHEFDSLSDRDILDLFPVFIEFSSGQCVFRMLFPLRPYQYPLVGPLLYARFFAEDAMAFRYMPYRTWMEKRLNEARDASPDMFHAMSRAFEGLYTFIERGYWSPARTVSVVIDKVNAFTSIV